MKELAAILLLKAGGNESHSAADVAALLKSVGVEDDSSTSEKLVSELQGKDLGELVASTKDRIFVGGSGGGGGGCGGAPAAAGGAAPAEEKKEKPKEEEIDFSGGMDMFGGGM